MSTSVTFNGTSYTVPAIADASWGTNVSTYLIAIASGCLQKTGGAFTLSQADVDFGATYGLKAVYFKSKTANIASAGVVQLARADVISWRNNANGADLSLGVTSGDVLTFNSIPIVSLALGAAYTVLQMNSGATAYTWATPTGTGAPVLANTPTLITPVLGVATATSINKMAITAPATSSTLAVADGKTATISATLTFAGTDGKTVTFSNSLTFAGTDGNTMTFPSGSSTVMTLASADTITGVKTFGDGKLVLSGSSSGGMTVKAPAAASTFVATFFAATDTVVGLTFQQTVTNKVWSDSTVVFGNVSDVTKALKFSLGGATTAKTMTFLSSHTNDRTLTFPDATDTLVGKATTDVFTNKTLSGNTATNLISGSGTFTLNTTGTITAPNATDTLVGKATTDALTNKDYQGGTASNTSRLTVPSAASATLLALTRKQATLVYDTTVNALYSDDGSNLNPVGSGAGEKNYISTGSSNAGGWTASGAGVTVATDTTAADLPRSITTKSGILISRASGSTAYAYYRFTLDPADYDTLLKIQFAMKYGASYVASDFKVDMYSNTASDYSGTSTRLALSTDSSAITALPKIIGTYKTAFGSTNATAPYMELRVGLNASTASTTLCISDVIVGPGIVIQGAAVSSWTSFSMTLAGSGTTPVKGTIVTDEALWRRVGDSMEIQYRFKQSATGTTGTGDMLFTIPLGLTIDTSKITVSSVGFKTVGFGHTSNAAGGPTATVALPLDVIAYDSTHLGAMQFNGTTQSFTMLGNSNSYLGGNANAALSFWAIVPIADWAGAGTVNVAQNDVEYVFNTGTWDGDDDTSFGYGPAGQIITASTDLTTKRTKKVRFKTPMQPTDSITLEFQINGTAWIPSPAYIRDSGYSIEAIHFGTAASNAESVGAGLQTINSTTTDIYVTFGHYASIYNNATKIGWSTAVSTSVVAWRVRKSVGGQAIGFGNVAQNTSGLVKSAGQLLGTNTNDDAVTGYVGEVITSTISSAQNAAASNSLLALANITLPSAGDYDVSASVTLLTNSATFSGVCQAVVARASASSANTTSGMDECGMAFSTTSSGQSTMAFSNLRVKSDGTNTTVNGVNSVASQILYLNVLATYSGGTPQWRGTITARRRR
jgi:hypothetical protein